MSLLKAVENVNAAQKEVLFLKAKDYFNGDLKGKKIAMWGLSFKPQTDDMREAPSKVLIDMFLAEGCTISAYDPVAIDEAHRLMGDKIDLVDNLYDALDNADCLLLVTEWKEFRIPDLKLMKDKMKNPAVFDGRNIYERTEMTSAGFDYFAIGK